LPKDYFFCCSRLIEGKNIDRMIDAFHRYRRTSEQTAWDLVIAGDGPLRDVIECQIRSLSLTQYVHLLGRQTYDQLPRLYASAGGFIMPSLAETWGLVVNEAMAAGLPVLVSQAAGCHFDLVKEGVNGHIFDPEDADQLAMLLSKLSMSPKRNDMGNASRRIIRDWDLHRFTSGLTEASHIARASHASKRSIFAAAVATALSYRN
jgi:glycosyltransferase involved in cell wall biosynthesis